MPINVSNLVTIFRVIGTDGTIFGSYGLIHRQRLYRSFLEAREDILYLDN
jgi:hypothetical protein